MLISLVNVQNMRAVQHSGTLLCTAQHSNEKVSQLSAYAYRKFLKGARFAALQS